MGKLGGGFKNIVSKIGSYGTNRAMWTGSGLKHAQQAGFKVVGDTWYGKAALGIEKVFGKGKISGKAWDVASTIWSKTARGPVNAFLDLAAKGTRYYGIEKPNIMKKGQTLIEWFVGKKR